MKTSMFSIAGPAVNIIIDCVVVVWTRPTVESMRRNFMNMTLTASTHNDDDDFVDELDQCFGS